jgi:hypothetical protein
LISSIGITISTPIKKSIIDGYREYGGMNQHQH